jgi:DNA-binding response OmpR family regulator
MPKTKILCIEDEPQAVHLLRLILEEQGYQVVAANGGRAGLEAMRIEKPDLIVLDLMLPDMDGEDVYQRIKHYDERNEIPVIVVTAKAAPIDKALWVHIAGVDDYITKPFGPSELVAGIERVLARRQTCGSGSV